MAAEAWLSVGLIFVAATQAGFQWWGSRIAQRAANDESDRRLKEHNAAAVLRQRAADADQDAAYFEVWAEIFRIESLANKWAEEDLVGLSVRGLLVAADVMGVLPNTLVRNSVRLGQEAAFLSGVALTMAHDLAAQVAVFNQLVLDGATSVKLRISGLTDEALATQLRQRSDRELDERAASIRRGVHELALLLNDVAMHASRASVVRTLSFHDDMSSQMGRRTADALAKRLTATRQRVG